MKKKKEFIEPELTRYEERLEEVTLNNYDHPCGDDAGPCPS